MSEEARGMATHDAGDHDLKPLSPREGVEMFIEEKRDDVAEKTLQNYKYTLDTFLEFCAEHEIENLNALSGRDVHRYRTWRRRQDVKKVTLKGNLAKLRVFLGFAARMDAVEPGLREKVKLPELEREDEARDIKLAEDRADEILDYLERFHYASRDHVVMALLWHTGIRLGTLRAFDLEDYDPDGGCLYVRHRPKTGTPLKNGEKAERAIAIGPHYVQVISDYIQHNRAGVKDEYGREPLIASNQGRLSEGAVRTTVYQATQPCFIGGCPHDREPVTCEATDYGNEAKCPSSRSPHGIRRGAITRTLREGTPEEVVSDRMNVSKDVLEKHYDQRTEVEKMEIRREFLEDV